jgi:quinol monooxygenase YgiN
VLVLTRYTIPAADAQSFLDRARVALAAFADRPGYLSGRVGRSTDDPSLWALTMEWESIGAYRRALSSPEVKISALPLMYQAVDEPSAYEVLAAFDAMPDELARVRRAETSRAADADTVRVGEASGPAVPRDVH